MKMVVFAVISFLTFGQSINIRTVTLSAGTQVFLETTEFLQSDQMTVGQMIQFKVRAQVKVNGNVAIQTDALAMGRVKAVESASYNNPASIKIEVSYVKAVDGQQVPLNGQEQTFKGTYPGEGMQLNPGIGINATVLNDIEIRVR